MTQKNFTITHDDPSANPYVNASGMLVRVRGPMEAARIGLDCDRATYAAGQKCAYVATVLGRDGRYWRAYESDGDRVWVRR
jgi:hypothetical protein